jgi:selenocysteine lyase/cysteine desulfurase
MNASFQEAEIAQLRLETPGCAERIHLNNAGASLMPLPVINAMHEHIDLEVRMGGYEAAAFKSTAVENFYAKAAELINAQAINIAYTTSATDAFIRALSSVPFQKGDVILTTNEDYNSNQIQFLSLKKRFGVKVERVASEDTGGLNLNDLDDKLHQLKPRLLAVTHIPTNSGLVQPVQEIGKIVAAHDTIYLLDACQAAGQLQLDVQTLRCDFMSTTFRKFLRGPRGAGFLYVSDKILQQNLEPLFIDMRGADWTEVDQYTVRSDAKRFETWEVSYAALLGSSASLQYALNVGSSRIEQRVKYLSSRLRTLLHQVPKAQVLDRGPVLAGLVTFFIAGHDPEKLKKELQQRGINLSASYRANALIDFDAKKVPWALRASPHYYNTELELETFVATMQSLLT